MRVVFVWEDIGMVFMLSAAAIAFWMSATKPLFLTYETILFIAHTQRLDG
jgi:hypothetical protein